MKYIFFFATAQDLAPVLRRFEANAPLKFIQTGKRSTPNRPIYLTSPDIPQLSVATNGTGSGCTTYLVSHRDTKNRMYSFKDDSGQQRWLLSNGDNAETTLLTPAGVWTTGTLLPGNMSTLHDTPIAQQLMRWFLSALKQERFTKIDLWWVGREALSMLEAGRRLTTTAEQSPPEFDLNNRISRAIGSET